MPNLDLCSDRTDHGVDVVNVFRVVGGMVGREDAGRLGAIQHHLLPERSNCYRV